MIDSNRRAILKRRFGAVLLVSGLSWMARADWDIWRVWQTQHWPTTQGVITRAEIVNVYRPKLSSRFSGGNSRSYQLGYEYRVGGHSYESQRIHLVEPESRRIPSEDAQRYPQGATLVVHYDPSDVTQAVLETNILWTTVVGSITGLVMAMAAARLLRRRRGGAAEPRSGGAA